MRHYIKSSPLIMKKLSFLSKYSDRVQITPTTLATPTIHIQVPQFCDFSAGLYIADLVAMARNTESVDITEGTISYTYASEISLTVVDIEKTVPTLSLNYSIDIPSPTTSARIGGLPIITKDECQVTLRDGRLIVESRGLVKTRVCVPAERLEGSDAASCRVRSRDLRIVECIEGEHVINFFDDCIVVYGLEDEVATAAIVRVLV